VWDKLLCLCLGHETQSDLADLGPSMLQTGRHFAAWVVLIPTTGAWPWLVDPGSQACLRRVFVRNAEGAPYHHAKRRYASGRATNQTNPTTPTRIKWGLSGKACLSGNGCLGGEIHKGPDLRDIDDSSMSRKI
jgi:hypothetical protein